MFLLVQELMEVNVSIRLKNICIYNYEEKHMPFI